jgi:hypothetical protein
MTYSLRPGYPDFRDLPWGLRLDAWREACPRLEEVPRGLSRHTVVFVNYDGALFALKELPPEIAAKEYTLLSRMETLRIPAVTPVGYAKLPSQADPTSVLITRYLEHAIPYRSLSMRGSLIRYQKHLLDAIASLMVQLHLRGIYWGDCSLSNTLFRRDAGTLQAYLVDAETGVDYPERPPANLRHQDLDIMEENVDHELAELGAAHLLQDHFSVENIGAYIRLSYKRLWDEISQEETFVSGDSFRLQERIRALNTLGFSVGGVDIFRSERGEEARLRVVVTDRNFHRDQLVNLTGLEAEEKQALRMMNEIQEMRASLSQVNNRNIPLSAAAYHWLVNIYQPIVARLQPLIKPDMTTAELYCQVLEHKWYLSERARYDIGHSAAVEDYIQKNPG